MRNQATTGLTELQWEELVAMVVRLAPAPQRHGRPHALDVARKVRLTLEHLRTNVPQEVLAEHYGISQPTVSRIIAVTLPLLDQALEAFDHGLDEIHPKEALLLDGTVVPTGRRAGQDRLYNGKHKVHGVNVQVLSTLDGHPIWASAPMPGADHDITCFRAHGLEQVFAQRTGLADAGYQGHGTDGLITPIKRAPGLDLTKDSKTFNRQLAGRRALIERVNAWIKAFKILTTRYRRTWTDLATTIRVTFRILRYRQAAVAGTAL